MGKRARRLRTLKKQFLRRQQAKDNASRVPMHQRASNEIAAIEDAYFCHTVDEAARKEQRDGRR
jgi:hypothetical protein